MVYKPARFQIIFLYFCLLPTAKTMKKLLTILRRFGKLIIGFIILLTVLLIFSNNLVNKSAKGLTFDSIRDIPAMPTAVVFGTGKWARGGGQNLYFKYRMDAVVKLFNAGKIKYIIVSGDNSKAEHNETRDMKKSLIEMGIPEENIIEDFAGFRTLDSVIRAKEVFGRDSIMFISQKFQNQRAIFIGKNHDIYGLGFNAQEVPKGYSALTDTREYFARVKAVLDVYLLDMMPKFYKDKEVFPNDE